jgi:hypothetical protein
MPRQIVARVLLVFAVLLAQQTALAHEFWHAAGAVAGAPDSKSPDGKKLCDLHDLLGTVLGAVSAAPPQTELLTLREVGFFAAAAAAAENRPLVAQSRGPPGRS